MKKASNANQYLTKCWVSDECTKLRKVNGKAVSLSVSHLTGRISGQHCNYIKRPMNQHVRSAVMANWCCRL